MPPRVVMIAAGDEWGGHTCMPEQHPTMCGSACGNSNGVWTPEIPPAFEPYLVLRKLIPTSGGSARCFAERGVRGVRRGRGGGGKSGSG